MNQYRKREIASVKSSLREKDGGLILLYGRRGIGKTELLLEVIGNNDIYYLADSREKPLQISDLQTRIAEKIVGFDSVKFTDWDSFFSALSEVANKKRTIVLDEFPYLAKTAPELPGIIQKYFDSGKLKRVNLILCGSSHSRMTNLFNNSKAPLYERAKLNLKLDSLSVFHLSEALHVSPEKAVEEYSVWGGVPKYWEERAKFRSLEKALINLVLKKSGLYYNEPTLLFLDEMRTSLQINSILSLIASGVNKLSEIAGRLQKPATHISKPLQFLIELDYLKREIPFGENEKTAKKSFYRIKDPFIRFNFSFVLPNRSLIELEKEDLIKKKLISSWESYVSETYEDLCRESIPALFIKRGNFSRGKRYWTKDVEIDIVSKEANTNQFIVGKVKWTNKINVELELKSLDEIIKKIPFLQDAKVIKVVFGKKEIVTQNGNYFSAVDVVKTLNNH